MTQPNIHASALAEEQLCSFSKCTIVVCSNSQCEASIILQVSCLNWHNPYEHLVFLDTMKNDSVFLMHNYLNHKTAHITLSSGNSSTTLSILQTYIQHGNIYFKYSLSLSLLYYTFDIHQLGNTETTKLICKRV